jgi:hypothetical protein
MTTGQFWDLMWNLPWYKRLWFAVVDDCIIFLTFWWLWAFLVGWSLYPIIKHFIMMKIAEAKASKKDENVKSNSGG